MKINTVQVTVLVLTLMSGAYILGLQTPPRVQQVTITHLVTATTTILEEKTKCQELGGKLIPVAILGIDPNVFIQPGMTIDVKGIKCQKPEVPAEDLYILNI